MNTFKKIGIGLGFAILALTLFAIAPAHKAFAVVTSFNAVDPFAGITYTMQNGVIKADLKVDPPATQPLPITFSSNRGTPTQFSSDLQIFCNSQQVINPSVSALITTTSPLTAATVTATLNVFYFSNGNCSPRDNNKTITITNLDATPGGGTYPPTIKDGATTYYQIEPGHGVYGLQGKTLNDSCYGGSVLVVNSDGATAGVYTGLTNDAAGQALFPTVNSTQSPTDGQIVTILTGCYVASASTATAGTVANGTFTPAANGNGVNAPAPPSCESNFDGPFGWIICPALVLADKTAGAFSGFIENQLCFTTTDNNTDSSTGQASCGGNNNLTPQVEKAWGIFRILASSLLVVVMLIMVISQAFGGGPFDAYTFRKLLPKMLAAVIFIQLSWFILKWGIDLSNDLGRGIADLMYAPFGGSANIDLSKIIGANLDNNASVANDTFGLFTGIAVAGTLVALSFPALGLMALFVVMALATAFFVLIFRKFLIVMLVILAPLAFVCWILPGTERYFQMWKTNFTKLLAMFPMIMAMIAGGRVFAYIVGNGGSSAGGTPTSSIHLLPHLAVAHLGPVAVPYFASVTDFADFAIILVAWFGPYFLLPQTFKWGGSALASISGGVKNATQRAGKPAKSYLDWRKGLSPWSQARAARKAESTRRAQANFNEGLASGGPMGSVRRARLGGLGRRGAEAELRGRIVQNAESEIEKHRREEIARSTIQLTQRELRQYHPDDHDAIRRAIITGDTVMVHAAGEDSDDPATHSFDGAAYAESHDFGQRAALDRGVVHGHWREIEQFGEEAMASGDQERIAEWQDFLQSNAQVIGSQMPHLLKGMRVAATSKPEAITEMRQEEIESILGNLSSTIALGNRPGATVRQRERRDAAIPQLQTFLQNYHTAIGDPRLNVRLDQGGARAVKGFVENNAALLNVINHTEANGQNRAAQHLNLIDGNQVAVVAPAPAPGAAPSPTHTAVTQLALHIDVNGRPV